MQQSHEDNSPLPEASRGQVARDMLVFQVKLFTDGLKDVILSPMSLVAGLVGIFMSRGNPGLPLYELLRFGRRIENWIDLFAAAYASPDAQESAQKAELDTIQDNEKSTMTTAQDFDTLLDRLQSKVMDPEELARLSERSKAQIEALAKKLRGE